MSRKQSEMVVFAHVVESGGFSAAARELKLTPSAVSKLVSRLEERLGVALMTRTTRNLRLTEEGETYYRRCVGIISDIEETERALAESADVPRGRLRVNSSTPFAVCNILPALPEFMARYPEVEVDLSLTDEVVDLTEARIDVAIRVGPLRDTSLRARKIGDSRRAVVASPEYLAAHGVPKSPADLSTHNCLRFNFQTSLNVWPFIENGKMVSVPVTGNFLANGGETLRQLAVSGIGIVRLAEYLLGDDIAHGRLVPLLTDCNPGDHQAIHAIFFGHRYMPARVRCFVDFLVEKIAVNPRRKAAKRRASTGS